MRWSGLVEDEAVQDLRTMVDGLVLRGGAALGRAFDAKVMGRPDLEAEALAEAEAIAVLFREDSHAEDNDL